MDHRYSHSAGRVSPLKAYLVERNRLRLVVKNFPLSMLLAAPFHALARYLWHLAGMFRGEGAAGGYPGSRWHFLWFPLKAHLALLPVLGRLWIERRAIRRNARLTATGFRQLAARYRITAREVAAL